MARMNRRKLRRARMLGAVCGVVCGGFVLTAATILCNRDAFTAHRTAQDGTGRAETLQADRQLPQADKAPSWCVKMAHRVTEEEMAGITRVHLGLCKVSGYCPCKVCTGKEETETGYGMTASGTKATAGKTLAANMHFITAGSVVEIDGVEYIAEDTAPDLWRHEYRIYFDTHAEAEAYGTKILQSFILIKGETDEKQEKQNVN